MDVVVVVVDSNGSDAGGVRKGPARSRSPLLDFLSISEFLEKLETPELLPLPRKTHSTRQKEFGI